MEGFFVDFLEKATSKLNSSCLAKEDLTALYASAFALYQQKNFASAESLFMKLCLENPFQEIFWKGLASSLQMQSREEAALKAWSIASSLQDADPYPHFHAAECFFLMKKEEDALKALELAEQRLDNKENILQSNINLLRELLDGSHSN